MAREVTHERKGHLITELATGEVMDFKTINAGKRYSRSLQKQGLAVVRVVPHGSKAFRATSKAPRKYRPAPASRAETRRQKVTNWDMHTDD